MPGGTVHKGFFRHPLYSTCLAGGQPAQCQSWRAGGRKHSVAAERLALGTEIRSWELRCCPALRPQPVRAASSRRDLPFRHHRNTALLSSGNAILVELHQNYCFLLSNSDCIQERTTTDRHKASKTTP